MKIDLIPSIMSLFVWAALIQWSICSSISTYEQFFKLTKLMQWGSEVARASFMYRYDTHVFQPSLVDIVEDHEFLLITKLIKGERLFTMDDTKLILSSAEMLLATGNFLQKTIELLVIQLHKYKFDLQQFPYISKKIFGTLKCTEYSIICIDTQTVILNGINAEPGRQMFYFLFIENILPFWTGLKIIDLPLHSRDILFIQNLPLTGLETFHMENCPINCDNGKGLNKSPMTKLKHFHLVNCYANDSMINFLCRLSESVEYLDISLNMLDPELQEELADNIARFKNLKILKMARNNLTKCNKLIDEILGLKYLETLDLYDNFIGTLLLEMIDKQHSPLPWKHLNLAKTRISERSTTLNPFYNLTNLVTLNLSYNEINGLILNLLNRISIMENLQQLHYKCEGVSIYVADECFQQLPEYFSLELSGTVKNSIYERHPQNLRYLQTAKIFFDTIAEANENCRLEFKNVVRLSASAMQYEYAKIPQLKELAKKFPNLTSFHSHVWSGELKYLNHFLEDVKLFYLSLELKTYQVEENKLQLLLLNQRKLKGLTIFGRAIWEDEMKMFFDFVTNSKNIRLLEQVNINIPISIHTLNSLLKATAYLPHLKTLALTLTKKCGHLETLHKIYSVRKLYIILVGKWEYSVERILISIIELFPNLVKLHIERLVFPELLKNIQNRLPKLRELSVDFCSTKYLDEAIANLSTLSFLTSLAFTLPGNVTYHLNNTRTPHASVLSKINTSIEPFQHLHSLEIHSASLLSNHHLQNANNLKSLKIIRDCDKNYLVFLQNYLQLKSLRVKIQDEDVWLQFFHKKFISQFNKLNHLDVFSEFIDEGAVIISNNYKTMSLPSSLVTIDAFNEWIDYCTLSIPYLSELLHDLKPKFYDGDVARRMAFDMFGYYDVIHFRNCLIEPIEREDYQPLRPRMVPADLSDEKENCYRSW